MNNIVFKSYYVINGGMKMNTKSQFDEALEAHSLELLKAGMPYINTSEQKIFSVYIKLNELINTIKFFNSTPKNVGICSINQTENQVSDMLNELKKVSNKEEKKFIEQIQNMMTMFQIYSVYKTNTSKDSKSPTDILKGMLTPSQQEMFDTYSTLFNSNFNGGNDESK